MCFTEIQKQPRSSNLGWSTSDIFTKPMDWTQTRLKTALNCHNQPSTSCFADTYVLQHVPVADRGSWLDILRTKQTPFIEVSGARKPARSSICVMKPHFLTYKFCTHCWSPQLCRMTYTHQMVLVLLHQNCWCAQGSVKMHCAFPQFNMLPNHRKVQQTIEHLCLAARTVGLLTSADPL